MMTSISINDNVIEIRKLNQYFGAFIASLGGFALGVSLGWNSSAGEVFRNHLDASATEIGLVGGFLNAGACFGVILVLFIVKKMNRIDIMFFTMPVFGVGWAFICFAGQKIIFFMIGRFICGICGGIFCVLTPIYVAEIADKEIRGRLLAFFQLSINLGVMYSFLAAYLIDEHETVWRYSSICGITCLLVAPMKLLPESPLHYLSRNDEINAEKSLRWYRGNMYDIQQEMNEMKRLIVMTHSKKLSIKVLKNSRVLRSFVTNFGVILGQQLSGVHIMIFYALTLFNTLGSGELTGSQQTLIVGAVQIFSCLLAALLVDILGRRILLTISTLLMGTFLILLGWFFNLRDSDPEYDDIYFWMTPTWITLLFAAFNLGLGPISWSLLGDTFPAQMKVPAAASAVAFSWLLSLMSALTFDEMIISLGGTKAMWLTAVICWFTALFCATLTKDTTRKSLIEIQEEFRIESNRDIQET